MHPHRLNHLRRRQKFLAIEHLEDRSLLAGIGVYTPATDTFNLRFTPNAGTADAGTFALSVPGTQPVVGDWNGDGQDDFGVFESATATWSLRYGAEEGAPNAGVFVFGSPGSIAVVGDWNGDGRDDIGTFDSNTARWTLRYGASPGPANAGMFNFGARKALPVVGDWDGDGVDGVGTFVASNATWVLRQTATAGSANGGTFRFGQTNGLPVVGDWNNDGRDGIGVFQPSTAFWSLRQTATSGNADAGFFKFGATGTIPVSGEFRGPAAPEDSLATLVLPPVNLDLLGLEIRTSPITVSISADGGNGKLLGNLMSTVSTMVDLDAASTALNSVLDATIDLVNSVDLTITGLEDGDLNNAAVRASTILELFVAPIHVDLLGLQVDTSPVRVTIATRSGPDLVLGNAVTELINLLNPPLKKTLDIDFLNMKLSQLLTRLNDQLPGIAPAPVPTTPATPGQILNVTVPALDLDLLGLVLETTPITINASATEGNGLLLGNVLTTALKTLGATPENIAGLNNNINGVLAKVFGVINNADLVLSSAVIDALPPAIQTLAQPLLTAPAEGATAPILDLLIVSTDGQSPPVQVDVLGVSITASDIEAHLSARTGEGQILGNILYNLANLADPGGPASLLNLFNLLGTGSLQSNDPAAGTVSPAIDAPEELLTLTVKPLDIDLLGLQVQTEPIIVTLSTQDGDGKLLGNLIEGISLLINTDGVEAAVNNVLSTTVDLVNGAGMIVNGVLSGSFDTSPTTTVTPVLDVLVAPITLDVLGLVATTSPIHLTVTARSGPGLVLGNVVTELANAFNPPLPEELNIDEINNRLQNLLTRLNQQIPGIGAPPVPVSLAPGQFLELTVPALDVDLLGLNLQTSPITVNGTANTGDGLLLGNVITTALNTVEATRENLTGLNNNLNALLAKVVAVLNAAELVLPPDPLAGLPSVLQTLASPTLITPTPGATADVLNVSVATGNPNAPPVDVDLLGLHVTTSDIYARLFAETGDGKILGNLVYNAANLLNPNGTLTLLSLLAQLARIV